MGNVVLTVSEASEVPATSRSGGRRRTIVTGTFTYSNSYATGGDTITFPANTWGTLKAILLAPAYNGARLLYWNASAATPKLQAASAVGTEVTATTDLSATSVAYVAIFEQG